MSYKQKPIKDVKNFTKMYISNTIPYILIFVLFEFSAIAENGMSIKADGKYLIQYFVFILFFYFFCFRAYIGADWLYYYPYFQKCPTLFDGYQVIIKYLNQSMFEKGYGLYNVIIKTVCPNYLFLQFVSALIDFCILHVFFKTYIPRYYVLGWALYLIFQGYVFEIIILRNAKSIMLFLISLKYINEKKPLKYFLLNLLGFLFHSSSVLYFPIYFIAQIKRRPKLEIIVFIIGNIVYLLQIKWIIPVLISLPILPGRFQSMLDIYMHSKHFSSAYGLTIGYLERTFSFILLYRFSFRLLSKDDKYKIFWYLFIIYSYVYLYCSEMFILLERIPNLFVCSYWILYPMYYESLKKDKKILFMCILCVYGILKTLLLMNTKWSLYENILFNYTEPSLRKWLYTY